MNFFEADQTAADIMGFSLSDYNKTLNTGSSQGYMYLTETSMEKYSSIIVDNALWCRWGTYVKISDFAPTPAELANAEMTFTATIDGETVSASMPVNTDNSTQDNFVVLDNITLLRITPDYWVFSAPVAGEIEFYEYFTVTIPEPGCYLLICDASGEFIYDSIVFDLVN